MNKMKYTFFLMSFLLLILFSQKPEQVILIFDDGQDTISLKKELEIYTLEGKYTFQHNKNKHTKYDIEYRQIDEDNIKSYSVFRKINEGKIYPDYFNEYSIYIYVGNKDATGCLVQVERVWIVNDTIID